MVHVQHHVSEEYNTTLLSCVLLQYTAEWFCSAVRVVVSAGHLVQPQRSKVTTAQNQLLL